MDKEIEGYKIPTMWAHYGDNHNGICLEIETDELGDQLSDIYKEEILYTDSLTPVELSPVTGEQKTIQDYLVEITTLLERNAKTVFFKKHSSWCSEQEFRFLYHDKENLKKPKYIDITRALKRIIIGPKFDVATQDYNLLKLLVANSKGGLDRNIEIVKLFMEPEHDSVAYKTLPAEILWKAFQQNLFNQKGGLLDEYIKFAKELNKNNDAKD